MIDLAIVGAGVAGAAAADALRDAPVEVTLFEKRPTAGGRAATRRRGDCVYDHAANYLTADDDRVTALVESLGADGRIEAEGPVWTFDADGRISEGDDGDRKWSYRDGIRGLATRLLDRSGATLRTGTTVARIAREGGTWRLHAPDGTDLGSRDALALTPPAPATADLLARAEWTARRELRTALAEAAREVPYRSIRTVVLHYPFAIERPYYALVNVDREHEIGWLSREECKPGRVPDGESLLVVQMAPDWSAAHAGEPPAARAPAVAERVAALLDDPRLADPDWTDGSHWRHALPDAGAATDVLDRAAPYGLHFAGDWVAGEGRLHAAVRSGLAVADRLADRDDPDDLDGRRRR